MSSLSERLAALNRNNPPKGGTPAPKASPPPKRRADVPTDAPSSTGTTAHSKSHTPPATPPTTGGPGNGAGNVAGNVAGNGTANGTGTTDKSAGVPGASTGSTTTGGAGGGKVAETTVSKSAGAGQARPKPAAVSTASAASRADAAKDRFEDLKEHVHSELLQELGPQLYDANLEASELESKVRVVLADVLAASNRPLTRADRERITQDISDDILGYGPLEPYLRDVDVAEVMVNGPFDIYLELKGKLVKVDGKFKDEAHLRRTIDKIVSRIGRRVDESSPMVDARLPDGSRVNAVVPPLAIDGSTLTIRKFAADPLTVNDLIRFGSMSDRTADFLDACVRGRLNVVVSGGTGSGKTTTLNVLSSFIPTDERIVTIEDAAELQLKQDHVVRLESRPPTSRARAL